MTKVLRRGDSERAPQHAGAATGRGPGASAPRWQRCGMGRPVSAAVRVAAIAAQDQVRHQLLLTQAHPTPRKRPYFVRSTFLYNKYELVRT